MYTAVIREAAGGSERSDKCGPIAFYARVPQTGVTGRGMPSGAYPCPFYLIVHVDSDNRRAEEKVANAYVGDVGSQDSRRGAKGPSGERGKHPSSEPGFVSKTESVYHKDSF